MFAEKGYIFIDNPRFKSQYIVIKGDIAWALVKNKKDQFLISPDTTGNGGFIIPSNWEITSIEAMLPYIKNIYRLIV